MTDLDRPTQTLSVEWVLIALLSGFALDIVSSILVFVGVVITITSLPISDIFTVEMLPGFVKSSIYWLVGVGVLWGIAHRLGFQRAFVLVAIGAGVSIGLSALLIGTQVNLFWMVAHAVRAALMGWVLWRLAYQKTTSEKQERIYVTTIGRGILALMCGGIAGGSVTMVVLVVTFMGMALGDFNEVLLLVMGGWLGGVFVLGGIPFVVLHHLGLRQWYGMTLVGGVIMLLIGIFVFGEISVTEIVLVMVGTGSVAGWIIWRVAYRRAPLER